jgi:hypothetical protein
VGFGGGFGLDWRADYGSQVLFRDLDLDAGLGNAPFCDVLGYDSLDVLNEGGGWT